MVYDGVEITVRKVIHTEDYRLRLIALRVRPGAGLLGWAPPYGQGLGSSGQACHFHRILFT